MTLAGASIDPSSLVLTFNEDFDWLDVSANGPGTRWIAHTPWNGDFGDARFVNPGPDHPFRIIDGILRIEARKSAQGKWESGLLASTDGHGNGFKQLFGYFEMRARFPAGEGLWPAFWLVSREGDKSIEVDVVEHYGHFPDRYTASLHVWDLKNLPLKESYHQRVPVERDTVSASFHTFGVAVDPTRIRYFFDRREVWSVATPQELKQPFAILLDLGMGGGWPINNTPNPSVMDVDYVRAWAFANDG
ncbi:glycoside hydrolase family 16 protein [Rhizobium sp. BK251]|uniref:glycoside hydrolase family 16 protein n=1 Tax=Rhizobium sp. BK251 TaxID=2512125 RepID=UPI001FE16880|nr:glycoside hydrolase family 16 protein [Rhizobium sp. BK251]